MAFLSNNVPYLTRGMEQVWNPERRMDSSSSIPSIPSIPSLSYTHMQARACARVCVCIYVIVVWKVWKVWKNRMDKGSATSIPAPYLSGGMELIRGAT